MLPRTEEELRAYLLEWRGVDTPCKRCGGSGRTVYSNTSTWHGGIGGSAMTDDVCCWCWGTGDEHRKGADLRRMTAQRRAWEAEQCAKWLAARTGATLQIMRRDLKLLVEVIAKEAKRRKPPEGTEPFWYARAAESLAAALTELIVEPTP